MRTETVSIYSFDDLNDAAKERARDWCRSGGDVWGWADEWWNSAQAFAAIAPVVVREADYARRYVDVRWAEEDTVGDLSGVRAWKWLHNNGWFDFAVRNKRGDCTMTGFCGDCPFGDALFAYINCPARVPELRQVFSEAAQAWVNEAADDMESSYEDEQVDDMIRANEYEFDANGRRYC